MSGRNKVQYVKQDEPNFLRAFKEKVGYKEQPTVDTKRDKLPIDEDEDDRSDNEDEKPQIVVLKQGDLTEDEVHVIKNVTETVESDGRKHSGDNPAKITFKKPVKRASAESNDLNISSSKKSKDVEDKSLKKRDKKAIKNKTLLSFGDEDEDDD